MKGRYWKILGVIVVLVVAVASFNGGIESGGYAGAEALARFGVNPVTWLGVAMIIHGSTKRKADERGSALKTAGKIIGITVVGTLLMIVLCAVLLFLAPTVGNLR